MLREVEILPRLAGHGHDRRAGLSVFAFLFEFERGDQVNVVASGERGAKHFIRHLLLAAGRHGGMHIADDQNARRKRIDGDHCAAIGSSKDFVIDSASLNRASLWRAENRYRFKIWAPRYCPPLDRDP